MVRMSLNWISCACRLTAAGLDVVLQLLAALAGAVALLHRARPDAPRHPADHGVLGVHAVAEEEAQVGREVVDVHASREVVLDDGEAVAQREGQLADRVRAGLGDVVAGDRDAVEIAHLVVDEVLLDVAHHAHGELGAEDAGVLGLVFLQDIGLHGAAHGGQGVGADLVVLVLIKTFHADQAVRGDAQQRQAEAVVVRPADRRGTRGASCL